MCPQHPSETRGLQMPTSPAAWAAPTGSGRQGPWRAHPESENSTLSLRRASAVQGPARGAGRSSPASPGGEVRVRPARCWAPSRGTTGPRVSKGAQPAQYPVLEKPQILDFIQVLPGEEQNGKTGTKVYETTGQEHKGTHTMLLPALYALESEVIMVGFLDGEATGKRRSEVCGAWKQRVRALWGAVAWLHTG